MADGTSSVAARVGIGVGLVCVIAVAYYMIFFGEVQDEIQNAHGRESRLRTELAQAEKATRAYNDDRTDLEDRRQRQRELSKILPASTEYPAFLSAVQAVANVAGVRLTAWTPRREKDEPYYARVPMEIELEGRYHQIAKFFYGVSQLDRIINIEDIFITRPKGLARKKDDGELLEVTALATAFHSRDPSRAPPVPVQKPKGGSQ